jgi:hypothetical protein
VRQRTTETISFTLDDLRRAASFPLSHTTEVQEDCGNGPAAVQKARCHDGNAARHERGSPDSSGEFMVRTNT